MGTALIVGKYVIMAAGTIWRGWMAWEAVKDFQVSVTDLRSVHAEATHRNVVEDTEDLDDAVVETDASPVITVVS